MLYTVTESEFLALIKAKEFRDSARVGTALPAYSAVMRHWAGELAPAQVTVLLYLIERTLACGRAAQRIAIREMTDGFSCETDGKFGSISLARTAIKAALAALSDLKLLKIYRTMSESGYEKESRMFEIDCKNLQKELPDPGRIPEGGGHETASPSYINYIDSEIEKKSVVASGSLLAAGSQDNTGKVVMLRTPKKPRAERTQSESALDAVARVAAKHEANRTARVAAASAKAPRKIEKDELQALFDRVTTASEPKMPRVVVTLKELGFFRKRLAVQAPDSLKDFIEWTLFNWHDIASRQRGAMHRRGETDRTKELPRVADFATFVYRFPYFLKVYEGRLIDQDRKQDADDALRRQLAAKDQQIAELRKGIRIMRSRTTQAPAPQPRRSTALPDLDSDLPSWDSNAAPRRSRNAR